MSDVQKLLKKKPCPTMAEGKNAERGERAEGVEKALKAGRGNVVSGAKRLKMDVVRPKMKPALEMAKSKKTVNGKG